MKLPIYNRNLLFYFADVDGGKISQDEYVVYHHEILIAKSKEKEKLLEELILQNIDPKECLFLKGGKRIRDIGKLVKKIIDISLAQRKIDSEDVNGKLI